MDKLDVILRKWLSAVHPHEGTPAKSIATHNAVAYLLKIIDEEDLVQFVTSNYPKCQFKVKKSPEFSVILLLLYVIFSTEESLEKARRAMCTMDDNAQMVVVEFLKYFQEVELSELTIDDLRKAISVFSASSITPERPLSVTPNLATPSSVEGSPLLRFLQTPHRTPNRKQQSRRRNCQICKGGNRLRTLEEQLNEEEIAKSTLQTKIQELTASKSELERRLTVEKEKSERLSEDLTSAGKESAFKDNEISALKEDVKLYGMQFRALKEDLAYYKESLSSTDKLLQEETSQKERLREELLKIQDNRLQMEVILNETASRNEALTREMSSLQTQLQELKEFHRNLQTKDQSMNDTLEGSFDQPESLACIQDLLLGELRHENLTLQETVRNLEGKLSEMELKLSSCEANLHFLADEKTTLDMKFKDAVLNFSNELSIREEKISALERENCQRAEELALLVDNCTKLNEELSAEKSLVKTLEDQVCDLEKLVLTLTENLNVASTEKSSLEEQLLKMKDILLEKEADVIRLSDIKSQLEVSLKSYEMELLSVTEDKNKLDRAFKDTISNLNQELATKSEKISLLENDNFENSNKVKLLSDNNNNLNEELSSIISLLKMSESEKGCLEEIKLTLSENCNLLTSKNKSLEEQLSKMKQVLSEKDVDIVQLSDIKYKLEVKLNSSEVKLQSMSQKMNELDQKFKDTVLNLNNELTLLTEKSSMLEVEKMENSNKLLLLSDSNCNLREELIIMKSKLKSLEDEKSDLEKTLSTLTENLNLLTSERNSLEQESSEKSELLSNKIAQLSAIKCELEESTSSYERKLLALSEERNKLEQEFQDKVRNLDKESSERIAALKMECSANVNECSLLSNSNKCLNDELSAVKTLLKALGDEKTLLEKTVSGLEGVKSELDIRLRSYEANLISVNEEKSKVEKELKDNISILHNELSCKSERISELESEKFENSNKLKLVSDNYNNLNAELSTIRSVVETLKEENTKLEKTVLTSNEEKSSLEEQLSKMNAVLSEKEELISYLTGAKSQLEDHLNSVERSLNCVTEEKEELDKELQNRIKKLEKELSDYEQKIAGLEKEKEENSNKMKGLAGESKKLSEELEDKEEELASIRREVSNLSDQLKEAEKQNAQHLIDIKSRITEIMSLKETKNKLEETIATITEDLQKLQTEKLEKELELDKEVQNRIKKLEKELSDYEQKIAGLEKEKEENSNKMKGLADESKKLSEELEDKEEELASIRGEVSNLSDQLKEAEKQNAQHLIDIKSRITEIMSLKETKNKLEETIATIIEDLQKLQTEKLEKELELDKEVQNRIKKLEELSDYEQKVASLEKEKEENSNKMKGLADESKKLSEELEDKEEELASIRGEVSHLNDQLKEAEKQNAQHLIDIKSRITEIMSLKETKNKLEETIEAITEDLQKLQSEKLEREAILVERANALLEELRKHKEEISNSEEAQLKVEAKLKKVINDNNELQNALEASLNVNSSIKALMKEAEYRLSISVSEHNAKITDLTVQNGLLEASLKALKEELNVVNEERAVINEKIVDCSQKLLAFSKMSCDSEGSIDDDGCVKVDSISKLLDNFLCLLEAKRKENDSIQLKNDALLSNMESLKTQNAKFLHLLDSLKPKLLLWKTPIIKNLIDVAEGFSIDLKSFSNSCEYVAFGETESSALEHDQRNLEVELESISQDVATARAAFLHLAKLAKKFQETALSCQAALLDTQERHDSLEKRTILLSEINTRLTKEIAKMKTLANEEVALKDKELESCRADVNSLKATVERLTKNALDLEQEKRNNLLALEEARTNSQNDIKELLERVDALQIILNAIKDLAIEQEAFSGVLSEILASRNELELKVKNLNVKKSTVKSDLEQRLAVITAELLKLTASGVELPLNPTPDGLASAKNKMILLKEKMLSMQRNLETISDNVGVFENEGNLSDSLEEIPVLPKTFPVVDLVDDTFVVDSKERRESNAGESFFIAHTSRKKEMPSKPKAKNINGHSWVVPLDPPKAPKKAEVDMRRSSSVSCVKSESKTVDESRKLVEAALMQKKKENQTLDRENRTLRNTIGDLKKQLIKEKELVEAQRASTRLKYEKQLDEMKAEMKQLYNQEVGKHKQELARVIEDHARSEREWKEQNKMCKEHIDELRSQLWQLGEKLLKEQNAKKILVDRLQEFSRPPESWKSMSTIEVKPVIDDFIPASRQSLFPPMPVEDEDDVFVNQCLEEIKSGGSLSENPSRRLTELQYRNSLCPPHLKSSYPAETQFHNPNTFSENELRSGNLNFGCESQSATDSSGDPSMTKSLIPAEKGKKKEQTSYKKPGPPTPSKLGRLSLGGEQKLTPKRVLREQNIQDKGRGTPNRLMALFTSKGSKRQSLGGGSVDENAAPSTPRSKGLRIFQRKPFGGREF